MHDSELPPLPDEFYVTPLQLDVTAVDGLGFLVHTGASVALLDDNGCIPWAVSLPDGTWPPRWTTTTDAILLYRGVNNCICVDLATGGVEMDVPLDRAIAGARDLWI